MNKIIVMAVPAESGGALTILQNFHRKAINNKNIHWVFVTSVIDLEEAEHVKVVKFPWIKKSWIHRLYFDYRIAPTLIKKFNIDKVFSLDNTTVYNVNIPQTVYMHQALPFIDQKFSFLKNSKIWIYQNIIGKRIIHSMKKADNIIVQTEWIKKAIIEKTGVMQDKITIHPPKLNTDFEQKYNKSEIESTIFFYPAGPSKYKNHHVIIEAAKTLNKMNISNYQILFTIAGDESKYVNTLKVISEENNLPIKFLGKLDYKDVLHNYAHSILLFPSYIESFGLPLLEARMHEAPIIASDMPFSKEILDGYEKAFFFDHTDSHELSTLMRFFIN